MHPVRYILVGLAVLMASAGPLPLVAHRLTCHHTHASEIQDDAKSCHHGCHCSIRKVDATQTASIESVAEEDCAICFQLAQLSRPASEVSLPLSLQLSPEPIVGGRVFFAGVVPGPNAPRGPPVA